MKQLKIIKANKLQIEDSKGKPRIVLDAADVGLTHIALYGEDGSSILLASDKECCSIEITHPGGPVAAAISRKSNGKVGLSLHDIHGSPAVTMEISELTGEGKITLRKRLLKAVRKPILKKTPK